MAAEAAVEVTGSDPAPVQLDAADFDVDLLDLDDRLVARRVNRILGPMQVTAEQRASFERLVRINEADLRLAKAIERDQVDEDTKEIIFERLDGQLAEVGASLPPHLYRLGAYAMIPEPIDGWTSVWTPDFCVVSVPTVQAPSRHRQSRGPRGPRRRSRRVAKRGPPRRSAGGSEDDIAPAARGRL